MPRLLNDKPCEVTFYDRISDSKITLFYRLPTTEERVAYTNSFVTRRGNKIESNLGSARLKMGTAILTGFAEGAFETDKGLLASDPASPHYDPAWKTIVRQYAPDVIEMLAVHVFESSLVPDSPDAPDDGKEAAADPL
jgi:hypothetical protein